MGWLRHQRCGSSKRLDVSYKELLTCRKSDEGVLLEGLTWKLPGLCRFMAGRLRIGEE